MFRASLIIISLLVFVVSAFAGDIKTPNPGFYCARTVENLELSIECEKLNDPVLMESLVTSNFIEILEPHARFTIVDRKFWKGYVKIQCICESYPVWVVKEAIKY